MKFLKKYLLDILVVIAFAIISFVYFMPADMDGRILFRHDAAAGKGLGHEKELFQQQTGETTRWTNSVFGGMPTYQMSPSYDSNQVLSQIVKAYHLWLPDYVWYVFVFLPVLHVYLLAFLRCLYQSQIITLKQELVPLSIFKICIRYVFSE